MSQLFECLASRVNGETVILLSMAGERTPHREIVLREASEVTVTVIPAPRGPTLRERVAAKAAVTSAHAIIGLVVVVVLAGTIVAALLLGDRGGGALARSHERGPAGVAAADGHPLRCLSITFSQDDPSYARADFDATAPCGRYGGSVRAIFHWVDGAWRRVLDQKRYSCPLASVPAPVQAELAVCQRPNAPVGVV